MYKFTKWIETTFSLILLVFGCEVENVIQNNLTIEGFNFYATLVLHHIKMKERNLGNLDVYIRLLVLNHYLRLLSILLI